MNSLDDVRALEHEMRDAGVDVTFDFYEGAGLAFFNDTDCLGTFDAGARDRSWTRTLDFLRTNLA